MKKDFKTFPYSNDFDFSDYSKPHSNYDNGRNIKAIGKFKDELNGDILEEFVGLMVKDLRF